MPLRLLFQPKQVRNYWQKNKRNQSSTKLESETQHCTFCDKDGHNCDGCFKCIGYLDWWSGEGKVDKDKPRVACVIISSIPGLKIDQYEAFLKHFGASTKHEFEETMPMASMASRLDDEADWVIDSSATKHTTYRVDILNKKTKYACERPVVIPNGDSL